ncbi:DUF6249 domain-containing protein [Marinimicrobium alkaliphilum]|uniref:DUF6249 domain-containing protein n=1 Tax=Marinimicrobium alkaliphilum TaxID=2202654 RepID=UPI000DB95639|nr:DUF6249 domain-containing protein [Marinimicrobium alkaliphilum]
MNPMLRLLSGTALVLLPLSAAWGFDPMQASADGSVPFIAYFAIFMIFGAPLVALVLVVYFLLRSRRERLRLQKETIQQFLEAGQPVPQQVLDQQTPKGPSDSQQSSAIHFIGWGVGLALALGLVGGIKWASIGMLFLAVGIAKLVALKLGERRLPAQD